jgi:hypothetical protein
MLLLIKYGHFNKLKKNTKFKMINDNNVLTTTSCTIDGDSRFPNKNLSNDSNSWTASGIEIINSR